MSESIIAQYHADLAADKSLTPELLSHLQSGMKALRLMYGDRALGVALRPHFLTRTQYNLLVQRARTLAGAFDTIAAAMLAEPALMNCVGLSEREQQLALIDPGFKHPVVNGRLDGFVSGQEVKFIEYNAENPSGLTDQAGINQVMFEIRALQNLAERHRLRQFTPIRRLLEAMLVTWQEWGGTGAPNIAILDWADLPTRHEFLLLRNFLTGHGIRSVFCTPDELEYSEGKLRRGDFEIDVVYKRVVIHELLSRCDDAHPLMQAYRQHAVCLINPFRCKLVHKKAGFELLTDEANQHWFSAAEHEAIHHSIPWTRRVSERRTRYRGNDIDLLEYLRKHRADFVLKPNDDYGGRGLCIGHRVTESEWENMLGVALQEDYIVQEAVALQTEEFPVFNKQGWSFQPMFVDINPFLFNGEVDGAMVRLSASPVVNVTSGGGETGFFVVED